MAQVTQTADDVMDSLTGHDEEEIAQQFGVTLSELIASVDGQKLGRALVFITKRRAGLNDDEARNFAMGLTFKALNHEYFADVSEADEESGKDELVDVELPPTSLTSVS